MPLTDKQANVFQEPHKAPVKAGVYPAQIVDISEIEVQAFKGPEMVRKYKIAFAMLSEEYRGVLLDIRVTKKFIGARKGKQSSNLYKLACQVMKENPDYTKPFDVRTLLQGTVTVVVKINEGDGGSTWSNITDYVATDGKEKKLTEEELKELESQFEVSEEVKPEEVEEDDDDSRPF